MQVVLQGQVLTDTQIKLWKNLSQVITLLMSRCTCWTWIASYITHTWESSTMPYLQKDHIELRTSESRVEDKTGLPRRRGEPQFHSQGYHWKVTTSYQKPLG